MKKLCILLLLVFISCQKTETKTVVSNPENFEAFNKQFHSDSLFQLSRVAFPIKGWHIDGTNRSKWTKETWEMHKTPVQDKSPYPEYNHNLTITDSLITEKLWLKESGFDFERRFKLIDNKWFLVYCKDINR